MLKFKRICLARHKKVFLFITLLLTAFSEAGAGTQPPNPGGDPSGGGIPPVGGGASLGDGEAILFILVLVYVVWKLKYLFLSKSNFFARLSNGENRKKHVLS
jgi:hypothetical protein